MSLPLVFRPIAQIELDESISWYESRSAGLGQEFRDEIEKHLERIANHPNQFQRIREEIRRTVLQRFPYSINFLPEANRIVILAVFHARRNPKTIKQRLRSED